MINLTLTEAKSCMQKHQTNTIQQFLAIQRGAFSQMLRCSDKRKVDLILNIILVPLINIFPVLHLWEYYQNIK